MGDGMMNIEALIPFNGQVIQTKKLTELGYNTKSINKLMDDKYLERTRKGYYKVTLQDDLDVSLMIHYLMNNLYDEFIDYFDSLTIKGYEAYYYKFMYDIMTNNFSSAYKSLIKCCELNVTQDNKLNLYTYVLLLTELMNLSNRKLVSLKNKLFDAKEETLSTFLEYIIQRDYDRACDNLRLHKDKLSKLETKVLRELSLKAKESYNKKHSPEMEEYNNLYNLFYECISSNDYDSAYYYFAKMYTLSNSMGIEDIRLKIIGDLFGCFNYIVEHQEVTLDTYKTKYTYEKDAISSFYQALNRNDYINALKFTTEIIKTSNDPNFTIYHALLERIYNFLNIRSVIKARTLEQKEITLDDLIKEKKYNEALALATKSNMDTHDKTMITSILESIVALDNGSYFTSNN